MKKIINRKTYNTETAIEIASWSNQLSPDDFDVVRETLYLTKKKAYFLYGEGGPQTSYFQFVPGGGRSGGSDITPLNDVQAYQWLEDHGFIEEIEKYFPSYITEA